MALGVPSMGERGDDHTPPTIFILEFCCARPAFTRSGLLGAWSGLSGPLGQSGIANALEFASRAGFASLGRSSWLLEPGLADALEIGSSTLGTLEICRSGLARPCKGARIGCSSTFRHRASAGISRSEAARLRWGSRRSCSNLLGFAGAFESAV